MASASESRANQLRKDVESLHKQIAEATTAVATARERAFKASDAARRSTSSTTTQSRLREAERYEKVAHQEERRRGEAERQLAGKIKDLNSVEARIRQDQQREFQKAQQDQRDALRRLERDDRIRSDRALDVVRTHEVEDARPHASAPAYDVFISHASEDRDEVARPLAEKLRRLGLKVWYDEFVLEVGDSLRRKIDAGLAGSRFGVVVLSPSFFAKEWPNRELDGLAARQLASGQKVVLPLWHHVSKDEVIRYSPPLADTVAMRTSDMTLDEIATKLASIVRS